MRDHLGDHAENGALPAAFDAGTDADAGERGLPGGFSGGNRQDDKTRNRRRNRRAMWISVGAVVALSAVSVPLVRHFTQQTPSPVRVPNTVAGLTIDHSANAASTADYLRSAIAASLSLDTSVGAVYTDGASGAQADAHSVIFVGGTTRQGTNASQVSALLNMMDDSTDGVDDLVTENPGTLGGLMKCGQTTATSASGAPTNADGEMSVCAFANKGSVGIALFPARTVPAAADLMRQMRPALTEK